MNLSLPLMGLPCSSEDLRDIAAKFRDGLPLTDTERAWVTGLLFRLATQEQRHEEQREFPRGLVMARAFGGWAVVAGATTLQDSRDLHVVKVLELPGYQGEDEDPGRFKVSLYGRGQWGKVRDPEGPEAVALGMVQAYRGQARAQKTRLCRERDLPMISASEHWDF